MIHSAPTNNPMTEPTNTPVNIDNAVDALIQPYHRQGRSRKYPNSNWNREVVVNISVILEKYQDGTLPEGERIIYDFQKKIREKFGKRRHGKYGRTFFQDWVIKTLSDEIISLNNKNPDTK